MTEEMYSLDTQGEYKIAVVRFRVKEYEGSIYTNDPTEPLFVQYGPDPERIRTELSDALDRYLELEV